DPADWRFFADRDRSGLLFPKAALARNREQRREAVGFRFGVPADRHEPDYCSVVHCDPRHAWPETATGAGLADVASGGRNFYGLDELVGCRHRRREPPAGQSRRSEHAMAQSDWRIGYCGVRSGQYFAEPFAQGIIRAMLNLLADDAVMLMGV